jgi:hypothetical protein
MSFLVPLYLAGLAALSLPFIFHLVRRTPRGRQDFSSLMFLFATPPRLTRRSRIDQLLLLALRLAALSLLAFAFARPFLREAAALTPESLTGRRVAIIVDTSASMRRADLWQQALLKAGTELDQLNPQDDVALFAFSDRLATIVDFEREKEAPVQGKPQIVRQQLQRLSPGWGASDLGTALTTVAGEIDSATDARQSALEPHIVVISDFQKGSHLEALQAFEWPERVPVVLRPVSPKKTTNAFLHVLTDEEDEGDAQSVRVRVVNAADSASDQFYVSWSGEQAKGRPAEVGVYVPARQSRVVRLARPSGQSADRVVLRGDDHEFDNTYYIVPPVLQPASVLYVGADSADDAAGLLHYLKLAVANDSLRTVDVRAPGADASPARGEPAPKLAVVSQALAPGWEAVLRPWVEEGGMLLLVPANQEAATSLPLFFDDVEMKAAEKVRDDHYLLLGDINFSHPLFAPFANPRYSDFTKIHFWKHRPLSLKSPATTTVVARFDNGDPAVLERTLGKGRILAFASGWQPDDSQLALSSKFVPLMGGLFDLACGGAATPASVSIGAAVALSASPTSSTTVFAPDGREIPVAEGATTFTATDQPGIYRLITGATETRFAVNLPAAESDTAPLDAEQLEQRGVRFGSVLTRAERIERVRQQRDTELESRQKVWLWLIAAALGVLIFETWWAGRAERKIVNPEVA